MNREYLKWFTPRLGREMELLVFGHGGLPVVVFPTSGGRFFEFEDRGMLAAVGGKIESGALQLFCADSIDAESWYNRNAAPRQKIARHLQYEDYLLQELVPLVRARNRDPRLIAAGCSFGGYHAVNLALRNPELFTGFLSMSGAFDLSGFLRGYYDSDVYFHTPPHFLANLDDPRILGLLRRSSYTLATGCDDHCLDENRRLAALLQAKAVPCRLEVWDAWNSHDWPTWQSMAQRYL